MNTYMIVCPLVFLAGFVDAIAGGGGLISLPAYMLAGVPAHAAIATNKLSSGMGTTISTFHFVKKGYMKWKLCLPGIAAALVGSWGGARLSLLIEESVLKGALLVVLPVTAFYVFRSKGIVQEKESPEIDKNTIFCCCVIALLIGAYDGAYGPGTGTFLILLFSGICKLSLQDSAGTAKAINLTTNLTSLAVYLFNGKVIFMLGLTAGICNMAGNYIGSHCFSSKGSKIIKPLILTVLTIFFVRILWEFTGA